jgi:hypothetical protein
MTVKRAFLGFATILEVLALAFFLAHPTQIRHLVRSAYVASWRVMPYTWTDGFDIPDRFVDSK